MKILIVNTSDIQGGAARAAYRLHKALLAEGVDSQMLVQSKSSDDYTVIGPHTKFQKAMGKMRPTLDSIPVRRYPARTKTLFSPSWLPFAGLVDKINAINPDVVHLHWIAGGMMRIEDLAKIKAPIVWSLHDMWAFTGGCHYDEECAGYQKQCGTCPVLGSNKEQDLSRKIWLRKQDCFARLLNMTIIGLSKWLADCAASSSLFKNNPVVNLPNPIDTQIFAPFDQAAARRLFNLPQDKKLILFGAMGATSDPRKGFKELVQALDHLPAGYELVVFGSSEPQTPQGFKQKVHYLGHLHDDVSLRVLYTAADVMVVPSLQENLSNAIMESIACGTPVIGFAIGGNADLIAHQQNGYLAKPFDTQDLAAGINWVLQHAHPEQLSQAARDKVLREFDSQVVAGKYVELYESVVKRDR
ncbi:MAG: glycosyltransferase family 4 protein [Methyloprofundus sp.]|nr:glycosyltransferase family 4 protein [Methyloprofundus sp.]